MSFIDELAKTTNFTLTENLAKTNISTLNPLLDYFALAGAMRDNPGMSARLFEKAFIADKQLAIRTLFYLRDIRGGQGERDVFYAGLNMLKVLDKETYAKVFGFIPEYGRWSDIFVGGVTVGVVDMVRNQLVVDEANMKAGEPVSLMAKWLPSENTSSKETRKNARSLAKGLGLSSKEYRLKVVALRKHIAILEQKMSAKKWAEIDYSKMPSQAFRKHTKAFRRHDEFRFAAFLEKAKGGEVNLNTSTLYTYEVYDAVNRGQRAEADAMWANLPDWTNGKNALVVADVSGSMVGRPMSISVSLALYFAERNQGPFKDYFMTFSSTPRLVKVQGASLSDKMRNIERADWNMSTNIEAAFMAILKAAKSAEAYREEMPSVLYIISDMEFDNCSSGASETNLQLAERKFSQAGYILPHVVFWNVNARNMQVPATKFDHRVTLISGFSQANFRYAVEGKTPEEFMVEVLNSERYAKIVV